MPHKPRDVLAGRFHVYTHCVWAVPAYFRDDVDRMSFLRDLARVTDTWKWRCIAFCLMTSHYHLIVDVGDGVLPKAMQSLNLGYALNFNRRHALRGHVQFRRYGSSRISGDDDLLERFAYVANNPVEAGLCRKAEQWPWSSYPGTIGITEPATFVDSGPLTGCFEWPATEPRAALRRYVDEKRLTKS